MMKHIAVGALAVAACSAALLGSSLPAPRPQADAAALDHPKR